MKDNLIILVLIVALFSGVGLTVVSGDSVNAYQAAAGDLRCDQVRGCSGSAGCNGAGSIDGCFLECVDGTVIACNVEVEQE